MESEHTAKTLQIALGSYDRKELRVEKNYLQEQSPALECTCFQNGGRLLEQLRQGRQFDVVILCSQLEDMSGLEFLMNIRSMDPKPNVVLFDEGRRQNTSAICLESGDGFCYVGHAELRTCCGSCTACRDGRASAWNASVRNCTRAGASSCRT